MSGSGADSQESADFPFRDSSDLAAPVIHAAPVGMSVIDGAGRYVFVNEAYGSIFGYRPDELVGRPFYEFLPEGSRSGALRKHRGVLDGVFEEGGSELTLSHRGGKPLFTQIQESRLISEGHGVCRLTTVVDLARHLEGEQQLRQLQKLESFGALIGDISNDFNNILAIIQGYSALLEDPRASRARIGDVCAGINKAVVRAANLVRHVQKLARKSDPLFRSTDMNVFLGDFRRMLNEAFSRSISFELRLDRSLPRVFVDPDQMSQAVLNVLVKARDAMPEGGAVAVGTETIEGNELRRRFPEAREEVYVALRVRVRPSEAPPAAGEQAIFGGTFTSVLSAEKNDLDMAIVYSVVAGHCGYIDLGPVEGGAEMSIFLPVLPEPEQAADDRQDAARPLILVVDDEESLLNAMAYSLEKSRYRVIRARDGLEALAHYRERHREIALVLCDLGLPRMGGWEAFMKMREINPEVRVIIMSGYLEPHLESEILRAGARDFVQKPLALREIVRKVDGVLADAIAVTPMGAARPEDPQQAEIAT